jgi:hypothetical protein
MAPMPLSRIDPIGALAGAATLSAKDALRFARHSLREGRRRIAPAPGDAPLAGPLSGVARGLIEGVDRAAEGSLDFAARAAKAAFAVSPLAPARIAAPMPVERLAALVAERPQTGAVAAADALYDAMKVVLRRLGAADALVLEQPLRAALVAALGRSGGAAPAARAAALARALHDADAVIGAPEARARLGWFALALALLAASTGEVRPGQERATLEAAADLAQAVEDEAAAAMATGEGLAALLAAYAPHL